MTPSINWKVLRGIFLLVLVLGCGGSGGGGGGDTTPPAIAAVSPINGATGVALNTVISATFTEAMDASSINTTNFELDHGVTGTVTYDAVNKRAIFAPSANLAYSTTYTVTIKTGIKDSAGNALNANYTFSFTTRPSPGTLDINFDTDGIVKTAVGGNSYAWAVAIQPDQKIVAAGSCHNGSNSDFALVRYNADGSMDSGFGTGGIVITPIGSGDDIAYAVAVQPDGKIVAAGSSRNSYNLQVFAVVRYNADGTLDSTFLGGGKVTLAIGSAEDVAYGVAVQSDGKIVAAGSSFKGLGYDFALVRFNTDGTPDSLFGTGGIVTTAIGSSYDVARAVAIQPDQKIVAVGYASSDATGYDFAAVRYNTDGTLDSGFGSGGMATISIGSTYDYGWAAAIQANGKIVEAGGYNHASGNFRFALARYDTNGMPDSLFGTDGTVITPIGSSDDTAYAVAIQSDGKIVAAGYSKNVFNKKDFAVIRCNTDGTLDSGFGVGGKVITDIGIGDDIAFSLAIQSDGKIVAAGYSNDATRDYFTLVRYWP